MKVAFYKAEGSIYNELIRDFTQSQYSHCELIFDRLFPENTLWFTASSRDHGVRFKSIINGGNWDVIDLNIDLDKEKIIFDWANSKVGLKYNWLGIIRFIFPALPILTNRWFCSEICMAALQEIGFFDSVIAANITPEDLYNLVKCTLEK